MDNLVEESLIFKDFISELSQNVFLLQCYAPNKKQVEYWFEFFFII